ncbi:MAG: hypothetical protein HKN39_03905 [Flavobacteriales bacterium]|nr:hypothetical protein [Flavobacteriales bacterium]
MKYTLLFLNVLLVTCIDAQTYVGQWRDHLTYTECIELTQNPEQVIFATESALFFVDKENKSFERLNKIQGLTNVGISTINYSLENGLLLVGYQDGGLNIVKGNTIVNLPDILNSTVLGDKGIYEIFFQDEFAWLSCGFGIVVLDLEKEEVKDTYFIGEGGNPLKINSTLILNDTIYASSENGLHYAPTQGVNLADFTNWSLNTTAPFSSGGYDNLVSFNGDLWLTTVETDNSNEVVYQRDNGDWLPFIDSPEMLRLQANDEFLTITKDGNVSSYSQDLELKRDIFAFQSGGLTDFRSGLTDNFGHLWVADGNKGGVFALNSWNNQTIAPNGPYSIDVWNIESVGGDTWVAPGAIESNWVNSFNNDSFYFFKNGVWGNFKDDPKLVDARDHLSVKIDPKNKDHVFFGSWNQGLVEVLNGEIVDVYNAEQGTEAIQESNINPGLFRIYGMDFDQDGNLWMANSHGEDGITVRTSNGGFVGLNYHPTLPNATVVEPLGELIHTSNSQVWVIIGRSHGLFVADYGGSITNQGDDNFKRINTSVGNGGLHTNDVRAVVEDLDGEIWIGTSEGITVFYNPTNIFSSNASDAQRVLVRQDGNLQFLLDSEVVTTITIDGGNRKWIGTENSGVFLMSEDGTEEIHHFTTSNSPLISNTIRDIGIDHLSGEVFIGTSKGIVSFTTDAIASNTENECLRVYPNPVKSDFAGEVAIDGLFINSIVKITDVAGNLVKETVSNGGRAVWDKTNFSGEKVKTGVYLAMSVDEAGESSCVTKILVIN